MITSPDKVDKILITNKQPRWLYYIAMESEECWQVELYTLLSLQQSDYDCKMQKKYRGRLSHPTTQESMVHEWGHKMGQGAWSQGKTPPKQPIRQDGGQTTAQVWPPIVVYYGTSFLN